MRLGGLNLVELFEQLACVEFSIVLCPESLNGRVDALSVGPAKEFCPFTSSVHILFLDLNGLGFIC
jgi:hypothetical protein